MSIKKTYKGVTEIIDSNHIKLNTQSKYLEDDIELECDGGESEPLNVKKEGTYTSSNGYSPVNVCIEPDLRMNNYHPTGNVDEDGHWIRPEGAPDITLLPITDNNGCIYWTYDTNCPAAYVSITNTTTKGLTLTYELGRVEQNTFVVYETVPCLSSVQYFHWFTAQEKAMGRYWVVRCTGKILTTVLSTKSYTPDGGTAVTLVAERQPIIERYGEVQYATAISNSKCITIECDQVSAPSLTRMSSCYSGCVNLIKVVWSNWNTANVTDFSSLFSGCYRLSDINLDFRTLEVTNKCTNISSMFANCKSLHGTINVTGWDVSKVTTMNGTFYYCEDIEYIDGLDTWYCPKCTNFGSSSTTGMFGQCRALKTNMDLTDWGIGDDTSTTARTFAAMFYYCESLRHIDLSTWVINNCTSMSSMFYYCRLLTEIGLPNSVSGNNANMACDTMFSNCWLLESVDLSNWDMSDASTCANLFNMCLSLKNLTLPNNIGDNGRLTSIANMFTNCRMLEEIDLSGADLSQITTMASAFSYCESAKSIILPEGTGSGLKLTTLTSPFQYCYSLEELDFSMVNVSKVNTMNNFASYCYNLRRFIPPTTVVAGSSAGSTATGSFAYDYELEDIGDCSWYGATKWTSGTAQYAGLFTGCTKLSQLENLFNGVTRAFSVSDCNLTHDTIIDILTNVGNPASSNLKITLGPTNLSLINNTERALATSKGWALA